ncbi:hypothetical protein C8Q80DRAFT_604030 [Daedaleopsis nitida]|nr:hypothetical protein C8Q80DRAFT_604030 [Daedaleopsis nitida]
MFRIMISRSSTSWLLVIALLYPSSYERRQSVTFVLDVQDHLTRPRRLTGYLAVVRHAMFRVRCSYLQDCSKIRKLAWRLASTPSGFWLGGRALGIVRWAWFHDEPVLAFSRTPLEHHFSVSTAPIYIAQHVLRGLTRCAGGRSFQGSGCTAFSGCFHHQLGKTTSNTYNGTSDEYAQHLH